MALARLLIRGAHRWIIEALTGIDALWLGTFTCLLRIAAILKVFIVIFSTPVSTSPARHWARTKIRALYFTIGSDCEPEALDEQREL